MQISTNVPVAAPAVNIALDTEAKPAQSPYGEYKIIRRNGAVVGFEPSKISIAMTKAYIAVNGGQGAASARVRELVTRLTEAVVGALIRRQPSGGTFHIEDIQDQVELALMRSTNGCNFYSRSTKSGVLRLIFTRPFEASTGNAALTRSPIAI